MLPHAFDIASFPQIMQYVSILFFSFRNLGIQCVKKKGIEESLRVRATVKVDPFSRKKPSLAMQLTWQRLIYNLRAVAQTIGGEIFW